MFFKLTPNTGQPLFLQLMQQIRHAIESGALQDEEQLPGIRTLAEQLVVSPNTVAKAYSELEHEGVLELRQGSGAFVCVKRRGRSMTDRVFAARKRVGKLIDDLREEGLHDDEIRRVFEAELLQPMQLGVKRWSTRRVRDLNLIVGANRITGFLGRNGAGKSTTIKMLLGMLKPTAAALLSFLSVKAIQRREF
jgi:GntR family transcriptional regulator